MFIIYYSVLLPYLSVYTSGVFIVFVLFCDVCTLIIIPMIMTRFVWQTKIIRACIMDLWSTRRTVDVRFNKMFFFLSIYLFPSCTSVFLPVCLPVSLVRSVDVKVKYATNYVLAWNSSLMCWILEAVSFTSHLVYN